MTSFEIYVFILCLIVFLLLTAMFTYLISVITKMEMEMIRYGHRDEAIKKELNKKKKESRMLLWLNRAVSFLLCMVLIVTFIFAVFVRMTEDRPANGIPSIKVVKSESMARKHPKNAYLSENGLDDQFQMFDIVVCNHLPAEDDLELYDIVVYKLEDMYVIHRIIRIEEPNENHPDQRYFYFQGDAVEWQDTLPVCYSQMQGIYEGYRIPFVGSFVLFLQSPAGWLCVLLAVFSMMATPIVEKKLKKETSKRILVLAEQEEEESDL